MQEQLPRMSEAAVPAGKKKRGLGNRANKDLLGGRWRSTDWLIDRGGKPISVLVFSNILLLMSRPGLETFRPLGPHLQHTDL
jgi:hypothetical protein